MSATRLTIMTEIISPYRIPVFNALAAAGVVYPHVIFMAENDPTQRQWQVYHERIQFSYEVLPSRRWRLGGAMLLVNRGVGAALAQAHPEVVIAGGYNYPACWQAQRWARKQEVPFALWSESNVQDHRSPNPVAEWMKRRFVGQCDGFLVPGRSAAEYLVALSRGSGRGVGLERICTAPNAVDNDSFTRAAALVRGMSSAESADLRRRMGVPDRYFVYAGRLVREKGIFDLVEAYASLPEAIRGEVGLVMVGNGPAREELEATIAGMSGVILAGFAQQEELPQYYALAEALIFPTWTDPWGLVVNEAMACGLPVVATNVAGCVPDLVHEGETGWVVPPRDPGVLRGTMEAVAKDPAGARRMGENGARWIQQHSPQACAQGFERLCVALLEERGPQPAAMSR